MSEQTPDQDVQTGGGPAVDPDGDPENLNPREGGQASAQGADPAVDPDSDPDMMNPRTGGQASSGEQS